MTRTVFNCVIDSNNKFFNPKLCVLLSLTTIFIFAKHVRVLTDIGALINLNLIINSDQISK